ncbi:MAG: hypothetical protein A2V70_12705 [Planctomycetes bacterium RBG_13_63_9]|nr:MAG: hypothetical protein A2V70_12705 [Planctomycetes bacterium RBG_13_63_9]
MLGLNGTLTAAATFAAEMANAFQRVGEGRLPGLAAWLAVELGVGGLRDGGCGGARWEDDFGRTHPLEIVLICLILLLLALIRGSCGT